MASETSYIQARASLGSSLGTSTFSISRLLFATTSVRLVYVNPTLSIGQFTDATRLERFLDKLESRPLVRSQKLALSFF